MSFLYWNISKGPIFGHEKGQTWIGSDMKRYFRTWIGSDMNRDRHESVSTWKGSTWIGHIEHEKGRTWKGSDMNRSYWARIGLDMNRVDMKRSDMNSSARIGGDPRTASQLSPHPNHFIHHKDSTSHPSCCRRPDMIGGRLLKRQIFGSRTKFNSWSSF